MCACARAQVCACVWGGVCVDVGMWECFCINEIPPKQADASQYVGVAKRRVLASDEHAKSPAPPPPTAPPLSSSTEPPFGVWERAFCTRVWLSCTSITNCAANAARANVAVPSQLVTIFQRSALSPLHRVNFIASWLLRISTSARYYLSYMYIYTYIYIDILKKQFYRHCT